MPNADFRRMERSRLRLRPATWPIGNFWSLPPEGLARGTAAALAAAPPGRFPKSLAPDSRIASPGIRGHVLARSPGPCFLSAATAPMPFMDNFRCLNPVRKLFAGTRGVGRNDGSDPEFGAGS